MLKNPTLSMSILLDKFEYNKPNIFIPTSLSKENKQTIINNYIDITEVLGSLYSIVYFKSNKNTLDISPMMKLKAQEKIETLEKTRFLN